MHICVYVIIPDLSIFLFIWVFKFIVAEIITPNQKYSEAVQSQTFLININRYLASADQKLSALSLSLFFFKLIIYLFLDLFTLRERKKKVVRDDSHMPESFSPAGVGV